MRIGAVRQHRFCPDPGHCVPLQGCHAAQGWFRLLGWDLGSPFRSTRAWGGRVKQELRAPAQRVRMARRCGPQQGGVLSRTGRDPFFSPLLGLRGPSRMMRAARASSMEAVGFLLGTRSASPPPLWNTRPSAPESRGAGQPGRLGRGLLQLLLGFGRPAHTLCKCVALGDRPRLRPAGMLHAPGI